MTDADPWRALLDDIAASCRRIGDWSGEARALREAIGAKRIGWRVAERIAGRLAEAGFESDPPFVRYESQSVVITPAGARCLAATVADLLPEIRRVDAEVPSIATSRDETVAATAVGRWLMRP